jgi:hypothetical protein
LFKRTKEYHKIKTKIDQFYNINEKIKWMSKFILFLISRMFLIIK